MRGEDSIKPALDWFSGNKIVLYGINYNPTQWKWTDSRKVYAQYYIDDAAIGVPLRYDAKLSSRPFVDWIKLEDMLKNQYNLL